MKILGRFIEIVFHILLPNRLYIWLKNKISRTKKAMLSNLELRIFWRVLFFPVVLSFSLIIGLMKTVLIWILPAMIYNQIRYLGRQVYLDISQRKLGVRVTWKRACLLCELWIKGAEKRKSFGDKNPDITFYVIRPYYFMKRNELATTLSDLLFHYYRNLQQLSYAINHGWVPVVDWENYGPFRHAEDYPVNGTKNCWEYYWKQPSDYTLEEVFQSKNVVLANRNSVDYGFIPTPFMISPFTKYAEQLAIRCPKYDKYFQLNEVTEQYIQEKQDVLFPKNARILGVSVRSMAYGAHSAHGHPIQPEMEELIRTIRKGLVDWDLEYVFFTCESEVTIECAREAFGDKLLALPRIRYREEPGEDDRENPMYMPGRRYQSNLDYLTEMVLLSRCTSLLAGMSSGVRAAIIWNCNKYERVKIFEKGSW